MEDGHLRGERSGEPAGADEIRRRATGGAALLAARGGLILGLGLVSNIVLARLLVPRDFGLVALGSVLLVFGGYLLDGGLGAALIRRPEPPGERTLAAVNGLQLAATVSLALLAFAVAVPIGRDALVVATMVVSLPITILRAPSVVVLERRLSYRTMATVDVVEAVVFYAWSIATVALGMGVWGMATGMVVRALTGTTVMVRRGPIGLVRPRWSWAEVRPLLAFGAKLQVVALVAIFREQGLNVGIAAIGGIATLGVWNLAFRVLQVPVMLYTTVARVSYPAVSRLIGAGRDPRAAIEQGVATITVATAVVLVAMVGFAPALPALVGQAWEDVPPTLAFACVALIVNAPVYVMTVGYLYAVDAVGAVLRSMAAYAVIWLAVGLSLLPALDTPAVGLGWIAGGVVNAALLATQTTRRTGASIWTNLLPPATAAAAAGAAGWAIATARDEAVVDGLLGALGGEVVFVATLAVVGRSMLRDALALLVETARGTVARPPEETGEHRAADASL